MTMWGRKGIIYMSDMKIRKPFIKIECVEEFVQCKEYCEKHERYVDEIISRLGDDKALVFIKSLRALLIYMSPCDILNGILRLLKGYYSVEVLDEVEWRYLKQVIRPFKNKIKRVTKLTHYTDKEYIKVYFDSDIMNFPDFDKGTMYKGMKLGKEYTLEELGL